MEWFISIVIPIIVGWLLDTIFGAPIKKWLQKQVKKISDVIFRCFVKRKQFTDYFRVIGSDRVNYLVYQLGLRPKIPLVDLLYLEFLHNLLIHDRIDKILLYPVVDLSYPTQTNRDFNEFVRHVTKVFHNYKNKIHIINPFNISVNTELLTASEFLETVKFVGSKEFIAFIKDKLDYKINNFCDFNKYHPYNIRLLSIFTHLIRNWMLYNYMEEKQLLNARVNLGFIIWETEVDKLGFFVKLSSEKQNIILTPILGRTIFCGKNRVIPVFEYEKTLNVFDEWPDIILKLASKDDQEIEKYIEILSTILAENYQEDIELKIAYKKGIDLFHQLKLSNGGKRLADVHKLGRKSCVVLYLIYRLRKIYEDRKHTL
jgi:hypothetical protein